MYKKGAHKEIIERYCHIIGENTAIAKYCCGDTVYHECLNSTRCEQNGGCKHEKYMGNKDLSV